ncbi:MAG: M17 family metallopeptidase [Gammaproteobacteria bacterium]
MTPISLKLIQQARIPTKKQVDSVLHWIIIFPCPVDNISAEKFPYARLLNSRRERLDKKTPDSEPVTTDLPNAAGSRVALACLEPDTEAFKLLTLSRKLVAVHSHSKATQIGIAIHGFLPEQAERIAEAVIAAACSAAAKMPDYKSNREKQSSPRRLHLYGVRTRHGFKRTLAEAQGNAVSRYLSTLPSNRLTPGLYLRQIRRLAKEYGWKLEFMDERALRKKKAGAFLAVSKGSPTQDAGIVRLRYQPPASSRRGKVALVGKGICYDTGGTNLKPAKFMFGMHEDMQGSAVALGTLIALSRLKVRFPVECWLALAMNHIGPRAYKPNDVVTAADGTSIEIVHTDAEGRMVLADTLVMASKKKPRLLIDYATLTGACVYSLGSAYSGVFTNRDGFIPILIETGKESGERVWPFPMDADYDKAIESDIADVKQCALEGGADHILAARFLQRFVKEDTPWIHMDLASSNCKGGLAHIPTDTTGFGIRYTLHLLLDKKIID